MKKPYLKKVGVFNGYNVWYVNGYYIRNNLDKEFTNFGSNRYFHFIKEITYFLFRKGMGPMNIRKVNYLHI